MQNAEALTKEQIQEFLNGSKGIEFSGGNRSERYSWVEQVLVAQEYAAQGKKHRGGVRAYIGKMTGLKPAPGDTVDPQISRRGSSKSGPYGRRRFPVKYTSQDIALLAEVTERTTG